LPDLKSHSSGAKIPQFQFPSVLGKTAVLVSVLKTIIALVRHNSVTLCELVAVLMSELATISKYKFLNLMTSFCAGSEVYDVCCA